MQPIKIYIPLYSYSPNMGYRPKCIGTDGVHKPDYFVRLYQIEVSSEGKEIAFSWCRECGVASVDTQHDGRFHSSISGLQYPNIHGLLQKLEETNAQDHATSVGVVYSRKENKVHCLKGSCYDKANFEGKENPDIGTISISSQDFFHFFRQNPIVAEWPIDEVRKREIK